MLLSPVSRASKNMQPSCWKPARRWLSALSIGLLLGLSAGASMAGPYAPGPCVTGGGGDGSYSVGANAARAMTEAANGAYNRDAQVFEQAAQAQAANIERSINCVGTVTQAIASLIPNFGGGIISSLVKQLMTSLSSQACQIVTRATNEASQAIGGINNEISRAAGGAGVVIDAVTEQAQQNNNTNTPANEGGLFNSVTRALSSIF